MPNSKVDPAKLNTLKELVSGPDFKQNLGKLIKTIYEFAFATYAGEGRLSLGQSTSERHHLSLIFRPPPR